MKLRSYLALAALALASVVSYNSFGLGALGGSAFPLTFTNQPVINQTDEFNELLAIINAQTTGISTTYPGAVSIPTAGVDTSQTVFSTSIQQNPLVQDTYQSILVSGTTNGPSVAGGQAVIASASNRSIHLAGIPTMLASGTAGTSASVDFICSGGAILESVAIAALVNQVPVPFNSTETEFYSSYVNGCPAGQAVMISAAGGTLSTTTYLMINVPYTVQ